MLFTVEQTGFFLPGLIWEYGRALGRSRRGTLIGKLLILPGAWVLFMGVTFTLGMILSVNEPLTDDEEMGMLLMVPLTLFLLLWGTSRCGLVRLPAALARLFPMRRTEERTCFYPGRVEDVREQLRVEYPYDVITDVYEGKRAFFLQLNSGQLLILQKICFAAGEPGAFRRLMDEKTGKPVKKL